jgi:hypothetical protein
MAYTRPQYKSYCSALGAIAAAFSVKQASSDIRELMREQRELSRSRTSAVHSQNRVRHIRYEEEESIYRFRLTELFTE